MKWLFLILFLTLLGFGIYEQIRDAGSDDD